MPPRITDGDFLAKKLNGALEWNSPFMSEGDPVSFEVSGTYRQDESTYVPFYNSSGVNEYMAAVSTLAGTAYLVEEGPARGIGAGLLEFRRTFASRPVTRYVGTSYVYPIQILFTGGTEGNSLGEIPFPMGAKIKYEYFMSEPAPEPAFKVYVLNGAIYAVGYTVPLTPGGTYLAEDSVVKLYKGTMYERRGIYVTIPNYTVTPP